MTAVSLDLRHVRVVGTGLLGTSLGLALTAMGTQVSLSDRSPRAEEAACARGAGQSHMDWSGPPPQVVVVCTPPDVAAEVVAAELQRWPDAVVTDVVSVKGVIAERVRKLAPDAHLARYVGSHPMAGSERSGPAAGRRALFEGCTWVVCPLPESSTVAVDTVRELATSCGATTVLMSGEDHDKAVAAVSHLAQVAATLVAGRLRDLREDELALSGQGIRDVTRIAASDANLWTQVLAANATALAPVTKRLAADLSQVVESLTRLAEGNQDPGQARAHLTEMLIHGARGQAQIPVKHGGSRTEYERVLVMVPDRRGALARLFRDIDAAEVNLEDIRIDHARGRPLGVTELVVLPQVATSLRSLLSANGWHVQ